jgi:hypothetical protein
MGTNRQVFSILGPHTGHYYGDIVLLMNPKVMHHPDFSISSTAATSFASGNRMTFFPWVKPFDKDKEARQAYEDAKLHASEPDFYDREWL